jgi:hypothetical protein
MNGFDFMRACERHENRLLDDYLDSMDREDDLKEDDIEPREEA